MKAFKKLQQATPEGQKLQQNVEDALKPVLGCPLLSGVLLPDLVLTTGQANIIEHKLGRQYRGFWVVRLNANAAVWEFTTQALPSKAIDLRCSANCTASIWIF